MPIDARYHVAVRRPEDDRLLVLGDGAMPGFRDPDAPWWQVVTPVVEGMAERHGLEVVALRTAWLGEPRADGSVDRLVEVAVGPGVAAPAGARWIEPADLERRPSPLGRAIDDGALEPADGRHQPWYRIGWFDGMVAWIDGGLAEAGLRRRGPVRQVRSWGRSALLTLETDRGRVWAKQVPAVFAHEIAVTGLLGDVDPGIVPPVIASDPAGGRMLIEHVDGPILADDRSDPAPWLATMARLAEIQHVLAADLDPLRQAGVPRADLVELADAVPRLVDDPAVDRRIRDAAARLADACRELAAHPAGPSLEHGDLSPSQVIIGEMGPVFLDWSDATLTHPFLAAASFVMEPDALPADGADGLLAAYLAGWGSADAAGARRAMGLARLVAPLHLVRWYRDRVLPGLDQPWEMERMVPWAFERLADALAAGDGR